MKRLFLFILFLFFTIHASANEQVAWDVDQCMQYAVDHSFSTARASRNVQTARQNYTSAIGRHLPQIGAQVNAGGNFGRNIDPATNTYANTASFSNGYSLGVEIPVFNALQLLNTTLMNKVAVARSRSELQQAQDDVALLVMRYFTDAQYYKGLAVLTERRVENFRRDLELATRRAELGTKSAADVAQFAATLALEEVTLISRRNDYQTAMLNLKDVMNFPIDDTLITVDDIVPQVQEIQPASEIFASAESYLPSIDVLKKRIKEQRYELLIAKGVYYPSLSVSGGISTNYFSMLGTATPATTSNYGAQLGDNFGQYAQATLSIPIFKGMAARTHVRKAKISYEQAQSDFNEKMRALRIEIEKAVMDLDAAAMKFHSATKSVESNRIATRAVQEKYTQGMVSVIELQTSSNQLLQAEVELLLAVLTLEIKNRQVDYYRGEALIKNN